MPELHSKDRRVTSPAPTLWCLLMLMLTLTLLTSGCEMMSWVHPRQLWKMNRQPAPRGEDDYFSVPDPPRGEQPSRSESKNSRSPL